MYKAVLDAGFTCPNVDGTCGSEGCIFCDGGSGYFTQSALPIEEQLHAEIKRIRKKAPDALICAYLQANTNTYAPVDVLEFTYKNILANPAVAALSIATRADCLPVDILDLLEEIALKTNLTVELGLQTIHNETAELVNRGHSFIVFLEAFLALKKRNIRTCVHLINGLPSETVQMMIDTAQTVGALAPDAVKIQMLHIIQGTKLAQMYQQGNFSLMDRDTYIALTAKQITFFPPKTVIERLTGDGDKRTLIAPLWTIDKRYLLGGIDKYMAEHDFLQGDAFSG